MATLGTGSKKESTEWDDILRAKGILPEKSADELAEEVLKGMVEEKIDSYNANESKDVDALDAELEDADSDEEAVLNQYRERRIEQMKAAAMKRRYGPGIEYVPATDWKAQVTEAGEEIYVVVHLVSCFEETSFTTHQLTSAAHRSIDYCVTPLKHETRF
jgi:hypothetical protein